MVKQVYVGQLPYQLTEDQLKKHFSQFGEVVKATIIMDRQTQRSKGFGFVTFATEESAQCAVEKANGQEIEGRAIVVTPAKPLVKKNISSDPAGYRKVLEPGDLTAD